MRPCGWEGKVSVMQRSEHCLYPGDSLTSTLTTKRRSIDLARGDSLTPMRRSIDGAGDSPSNAHGSPSSSGHGNQQPREEKFLRALGPGEYFGEVSLLYDTQRTVGPMTCCNIVPSSFSALDLSTHAPHAHLRGLLRRGSL